jgi:hypothetical protein
LAIRLSVSFHQAFLQKERTIAIPPAAERKVFRQEKNADDIDCYDLLRSYAIITNLKISVLLFALWVSFAPIAVLCVSAAGGIAIALHRLRSNWK